MQIVVILIYLLAPALVLYLCKKSRFLGKIGPVLLLYLAGILLGNTLISSDTDYSLQDTFVTFIVPIAIPLMLFSCNFSKWDIKGAVMTLLTGVFSVVITIVIGYFIFKNLIGDDPLIGASMDKISGMLAGVYTGGTPNLAAIKLMLNVPNETYIMIHSYDMAISLLYLTFVLSFGIPLFRKVLHIQERSEGSELDFTGDHKIEKFSFKELSFALALSIGIFITAGALSMLFSKDSQMVIVILTITTLGIAMSFIKRVREIKVSYNAGMYLIYIFSIVVASMANLSNLNLKGGLYLLLYISFVIFGSLFIQLLLARLFKIDADTILVSSVSLINSPPFVPLVATAMKNRTVIVTGLTVGLVGYAVGNYLGWIIAFILK